MNKLIAGGVAALVALGVSAAVVAPANAFPLALLISSTIHGLTWLLFKRPRTIKF